MKKKQKQKTKEKQQHQYLESIIQLAFFYMYLPLTYNLLLSDTDQQSEVPNIIIKFGCKVNSFIYTALLLALAEPEGLWQLTCTFVSLLLKRQKSVIVFAQNPSSEDPEFPRFWARLVQ